jgi:hypothetical protein
MKHKLLLMLVSIIFLTSASATNGVVELNHICATQLGCFGSDSVGYPITIDGSAGQSYRLTSNLIIPDENTHGIVVNTINVAIDLNGFSIVRSGCENSAVDCTAVTGTGVGIVGANSTYTQLSVINGSIVGMGLDGINNVAGSASYDNLNLKWNRNRGIFTGNNSKIFNSNASYNGDNGIQIGEGSMAKNNVVAFNSANGLSGAEYSNIEDNISTENGEYGIEVGIGAIVNGNTVSQNTLHGIWCYDSMVYQNNVNANILDGIYAFSGCNIKENTVLDNGRFGINASPSLTLKMNQLEKNTLIGNASGTINGTHYFELGRNFCETDDVCP